MGSDSNLPPELPETWLNQLKDVLKKSTRTTLLLTLLGSSAVAAIVTAGSNFVLKIIELRNNVEIENYKVCLAGQKQELTDLRDLYSPVLKKYREFEADFSNCIETCKDAYSNLEARQTPHDAYETLIKVSNDLAELQTAADDETGIAPELRTSLKQIIDPLILKIFATLDNDRKVAKVNKLPEFVKSAETDQPKIVQMKVQLQNAFRSLKPSPCPTKAPTDGPVGSPKSE